MTATESAPPAIDLLADTWEDRVPHDLFDWLRVNDPVHWHAEPNDTGFWFLSRHADVQAASRDPETFSSELGATFIPTQHEESLATMRLTILNMDGPKHHRYRRLVSKGFTPKVIQSLMDNINERAVRIVDDVAQLGSCEFVEQVAGRLPLEVICDMIGVPAQDRKKVFDWSNMLVGFDDPEFQANPEMGQAAAAEMFGYCMEIAADRRANPQEDIMTALVNAEIDGDRLDDMELNLFFVTLAVAGNETTRNLINHAMLAMIDHPDQAQRLRDDPSLLPSAVDECLRWGSSIHNFRRTATKDVTFGGKQIKAGDKVVLGYMAANHDPTVFADPHTFDIGRTPNDHVTFGGGGVHFCLGANLARAEIGAIMSQLVNRLPDLHLAGPARRLRSDFINGIKEMPVAFTPEGA